MDSLCEIAYGIDFFRIFTVMIVGPGTSVQSLNLRVERERWVRQWEKLLLTCTLHDVVRSSQQVDPGWLLRGRPGAPSPLMITSTHGWPDEGRTACEESRGTKDLVRKKRRELREERRDARCESSSACSFFVISHCRPLFENHCRHISWFSAPPAYRQLLVGHAPGGS